jgi:hypothetical protein
MVELAMSDESARIVRPNGGDMTNKPGRRRLYPEVAMSVYYARLTATHARFARRIGDGNLSEGIRIAIEHYEGCSIAQEEKAAREKD